MSNFSIFTIMMLLFAIVIASPVFTIIALNTLFNTGIELNVGTWFATFWLQFVLYGVGRVAATKA